MRKLQATIPIVLTCLLLGGCFEADYQTLKPSEGGEYTEALLGVPPAGMWFWPRGRITGDLDKAKNADGDFQKEEIVLVRLQQGSRQHPAPSPEVWLRVFHRNPENGRLEPVAAKKIYALGKVPANFTLPEEVTAKWADGPVTAEDLALADLDGNGTLEILVSLMHPAPGGMAVIHSVYALRDGELNLEFGCLAIQAKGKLIAMDIDEDGSQELIVPAAVLPPLGSEARYKRPQWPCIYARAKGGEGRYRQRNQDYPGYYDKVIEDFYADLLRGILAGRKAEFNTHCFYLGLIYSYRQDFPMAEALLRRAEKAPGDLGKVARQALADMEVTAPAGAPPAKPDL